MVTPQVVTLLVIIAICTNSNGLSALPTVNSVSPPKPQEITGKLENGAQSNTEVTSAALGPSSATSTNVGLASTKTIAAQANVKTLHANNAEKLKRGLTNFMNHLNPATYFVPPKVARPAGSQAEPATIVNDGSTAEVVIKGPNRLVQARQLGGPLRWGRR